MLLGLLSLLLSQSASWISEICVDSTLFSTKFYLCSEEEYGSTENIMFESSLSSPNKTEIPAGIIYSHLSHQCGEVK